jgi:lipoprotein-anchoring transpeptidase ErfK/SrfK
MPPHAVVTGKVVNSVNAMLSRRHVITGLAAMPALAVGMNLPALAYEGAEYVEFHSPERPGTVIVNTHRRRLYQLLGDGMAIRYGVAVGKAGFDWAGVATVGRKVEWPTWTPPRAMIRRKPELARWANGMPGGPENPLGARAIYLYAHGRDTLFRIHGTNEPWSIGKAASSGCIRMLNEEVGELYDNVRIGTKVIVI